MKRDHSPEPLKARKKDVAPPFHPSNATGSHLTITVDELMNLRLVALGAEPPTLGE